MTEPWERQQGESEEAFRGFTAYLEMGENRTVIRACEIVQGHPIEGTQPPRHWKEWCADWKWVDRARAYDNWKVGIEREAEAKEAAKKAAARERRRQEQVDIDLGAARELRELASLAYAALRPHIRSKISKSKGENGETVNIHPAKVSIRDIAAAHKMATDLERIALDMATKNIRQEVTGADGGPLQIETTTHAAEGDLRHLPEEERAIIRETARQLAEKRRERQG